MTPTQHQAVWELCRQGLPLVADLAADHWENGQSFKLDAQIRVAREIRRLVDQSNWENRLTAHANERHEPL